MAEKPKHACQMTVTIGGHIRQDIADVLLDLAVRLGNNELGIEGYGASPSGSYDYKLTISDSPTQREYHIQLCAWLESKHEQKANAGVNASAPTAWMHIQGNHEEPSLRRLDDDEKARGWTEFPLYSPLGVGLDGGTKE